MTISLHLYQTSERMLLHFYSSLCLPDGHKKTFTSSFTFIFIFKTLYKPYSLHRVTKNLQIVNKKLSRKKVSDLRYLKFCVIIFVKQSHKKLTDKGRLWTRNQTPALPNKNESAKH